MRSTGEKMTETSRRKEAKKRGEVKKKLEVECTHFIYSLTMVWLYQDTDPTAPQQITDLPPVECRSTMSFYPILLS
jgi:hypothetical protein